MSGFKCKQCGEPCEVVLVDFGIGPYEFQGQRGVDVNKQWASACCESEYVDDYQVDEEASDEE
jgi:hypothetical protein